MKKIMVFFNGVKKELSRVKWPNKKYMFKYSVAVITLSAFFSLFLYAINFIVAFLKVWLR